MKTTVNLLKFVAVLMMMFFMATLAGGEAQAANMPDWLKITWKQSLVRNSDKSVTIKSPNYWMLQIAVTHTNKSRDRDITAIYDKTLTYTAAFNQKPTNVSMGWDDPIKRTAKFGKVIKVELWPQQSETLNFFISLDKLIKTNGNWKDVNERIAMMKGDATKLFKGAKVSYDCEVRSRRSE